jgi:hypothetical protein
VNKKQKVLTIAMLPMFLFVGLLFLASPAVSLAGAFTGWFVLAVLYAALLILLRF